MRALWWICLVVACASKPGGPGDPSETETETTDTPTETTVTIPENCRDVAPENATSTVIVNPGPTLVDCEWTCDPGMVATGASCLDNPVCLAGWCLENAKPASVLLNSAWGTSSSDIWVAGEKEVIAHWDGSDWTAVAFDEGWIHSLHGSSSSDVWTIGSVGYTRHFDGASWSELGSVDLDMLAYDIFVHSPTEAFAVGEYQPTDEGVLWAFNGVDWDQVPGVADEKLEDIEGTGPNDLWAAGDSGLYYFDGNSLSFVASPTGTFYRGMVVLPSGDPVVIWDVAANRWDGQAWIPESAPADLDAAALVNGVAYSFEFYEGQVYERGPAGNWSAFGQPAPWDITGIGEAGDTVVVLGREGEVAIHDPAVGAFQEISTGPRTMFEDGCSLADNDIWLVGYGQQAWSHWDGMSWTTGSVAGDWLTRVACAATDEVYAAGDYGVNQWNGTEWEQISNQFGTVDLDASGPGDLWAARSNGAVNQWNGVSWTDHQPAAGDLLSIAAVGPSQVYVGGRTGMLKEWDGATWTRIDLAGVTSDDITGIEVTSPTDLWIADQWGAVFHFDGQDWREIPIVGSRNDTRLFELLSGGVGAADGTDRFRRYTPNSVVEYEIIGEVAVVLDRGGQLLVADEGGGIQVPEP